MYEYKIIFFRIFFCQIRWFPLLLVHPPNSSLFYTAGYLYHRPAICHKVLSEDISSGKRTLHQPKWLQENVQMANSWIISINVSSVKPNMKRKQVRRKCVHYNRFKLWRGGEGVIIHFTHISVLTAGYEFTENCGWSDEQQQVDASHKPCSEGTFNDGSHVKCQTCRFCQTTQFIGCNATSDTICCKEGYILLRKFKTFAMFASLLSCHHDKLSQIWTLINVLKI